MGPVHQVTVGVSNLLAQSSQYFLSSISVKSLVMSSLSLLILINCLLFLLIILSRDFLSILLIFSKNPFWISMIFFYCISVFCPIDVFSNLHYFISSVYLDWTFSSSSSFLKVGGQQFAEILFLFFEYLVLLL